VIWHVEGQIRVEGNFLTKSWYVDVQVHTNISKILGGTHVIT
jgi:hypothetical protein